MSASNRQILARQRLALGAFTVPELLAVVAVIVILISILMPSMDWARYRTRSATCLSAKHQVAVGMRSYAVDNQNRFPNAQGNGNQYWMQDYPAVVFTALRDQYGIPLNMWACPVSKTPRNPYHWGGYNPSQKWKMYDSAWWVIRGSIGASATVNPSRPHLVSDRTGLVPGSSVLISEYITGATLPTGSPHAYNGVIYEGTVGRADGSGESILVKDMIIRCPNEGWGAWWY